MNGEELNGPEQDEAERGQLESERRLATFFSNLPGIAYSCKNDGNWTMEFVSDGCEAITGHKAADLVGSGTHTYKSLIHPDDQQRIWNEVQEAVGQGTPFRLTYRILAADGREKWVFEIENLVLNRLVHAVSVIRHSHQNVVAWNCIGVASSGGICTKVNVHRLNI